MFYSKLHAKTAPFAKIAKYYEYLEWHSKKRQKSHFPGSFCAKLSPSSLLAMQKFKHAGSRARSGIAALQPRQHEAHPSPCTAARADLTGRAAACCARVPAPAAGPFPACVAGVPGTDQAQCDSVFIFFFLSATFQQGGWRS